MAYTELGTSRRIDTAAGTVHFHDAGHGPPLVLIQAFGPLPGTSAWLTYGRVIDELADQYRCIAVDFPNFGRSDPVEFHEPVHDVCARAVLAVLDHLGVERAPFVGTSMGATTALVVALTAPERVDRLVIGACHASTGGDPYLLAPFPSEVMRLFEECQLSPADEDRIGRLLRALVYDPEVLPAGLAAAMHRHRVDEPQHADTWARSVSVAHSNVADLAAIDVPTLVIHGRFDRMVPLEQALMLISHLPQADLVVLNRCGHWPPVERPAEFAAQVLQFLGRTDAEPSRADHAA